MKRRVVIIGGGLAGLAAAVRIAEHGDKPIVIESRKKLGGRATSFVDPRTGETLDNCQHVLMGCCTHLIDLYDRLGVLDLIDWHRTYYWTKEHGEIDRLAVGVLPAPLHLARSLSRMRLFDRDQKRAIRRAMWRMIRMGPAGRLRWRGRTFAAFLDEQQQPESVKSRFWSAVIVSACNLSIDRVDACYALQVFQDGFLRSRWSVAMGVPSVRLSAIYDPAADLLAERGGEIHLGVPARAIAFDGGRVTGVVTDDGLIEGAAVISAVPPDRLHKLTTQTMRKADARLQSLDQFTFSPILGVHLTFEQPIMDVPHLTVIDAGVQWLFNKSVDDDGSQYVHAVISAADEWMELDEREIVARVMEDIHRAVPRSVGLSPIVARTVKEKRATFAAVAGVDRIRPSVTPGTVGLGGGGIRNLFLAGDWVDTGWPATMEGAVRSGYAAADAWSGKSPPVEEVPPGLLARVLGLQ